MGWVGWDGGPICIFAVLDNGVVHPLFSTHGGYLTFSNFDETNIIDLKSQTCIDSKQYMLYLGTASTQMCFI